MGAFLTTLFGGVVTSVLSNITGRTAKTLAFVALVVSLTVGLVATLDALAASVAVVLPNDVVAMMTMLMPSNTAECISVVITGRIARWVYDWHVTIARTLAE